MSKQQFDMNSNHQKGVKTIAGFQNRQQHLPRDLTHRDNSQLRNAVK